MSEGNGVVSVFRKRWLSVRNPRGQTAIRIDIEQVSQQPITWVNGRACTDLVLDEPEAHAFCNDFHNAIRENGQ